jgi:hypothetical protein
MFKSFTASDKKLPASGKPSSRSKQPQPSRYSEPPATLQWSVKLMLAGAAVSTVYLVFAVIVTFSVKSSLARWNATEPKAKQLTTSQLNSLATYYIVSTVIIGLIAIGLWLWMARMNTAGRSWARITASVLFLLRTYYTYVSIGQTHGAATLITSTAIVLVTWLIGLAALWLLWRPASSAFIKAQSR